MSTLFEHTLVDDFGKLRRYIGEPDTVIDVGAGLRPALWAKAGRHICIEPCQVYADVLREHGIEVIEKRALDGLPIAPEADLVLMLDVIEHMEKDEGLAAIALALVKGRRVIVYTPNGFVEQESDNWGYGQDEYQRHRSGWMPEDFAGWKILRSREGFAAIHGDDACGSQSLHGGELASDQG